MDSVIFNTNKIVDFLIKPAIILLKYQIVMKLKCSVVVHQPAEPKESSSNHSDANSLLLVKNK